MGFHSREERIGIPSSLKQSLLNFLLISQLLLTPSCLSFTTTTTSLSFTTLKTSPPLKSLQTTYMTTSSKDEEEDTTNSENNNISNFCMGTNNFWKNLVIPSVQNYVEIQPAGTSSNDFFSKVIAPPEVPGIPRPVWFTIAASVPTALGWYGYYKFSVEEELYQYELETTGKVSGCGGYGTLFPFVYGILIGFPLSFLHVPGGETLVDAAALWILLGQVNLYRRVNEIVVEEGGEAPLHAWWALLPPPLDVVVGLRQVHYLSEYWRVKRGEEYDKDVVAEELFPFISAPRFTLKEFFRTPSMWFWFTKEWNDFEIEFLKD